MEIKERDIKGIFEITLAPHKDSRGFFMRTFDDTIFKQNGLDRKWVQENHAKTEQKNVIRGLHFQLPPFTETKLLRCISGAVLDVFVDLRSNSATFGKWDSIELSGDNMKMIFIPRGFAHGYCTLTEKSEVLYKVDNYYNPKSECGLLWDDPDIGISWPVKDPILSEKDSKNLPINEFIKLYQSIKNF